MSRKGGFKDAADYPGGSKNMSGAVIESEDKFRKEIKYIGIMK